MSQTWAIGCNRERRERRRTPRSQVQYSECHCFVHTSDNIAGSSFGMVSALEMGWYQQPATRFEWRYQTRWIYRDWAAGPGPGSWISGCGAVANLKNIPGVVGYLCLFLFRYNLYDYMYFSKFLDVCWLWRIFFLVSLLIACFFMFHHTFYH